MEITKLLDLENDGLNLAADEDFLYIRCKRVLDKYRLDDMTLAARNTVFRKDGKSRCFSLCGAFIYLVDFCDLYVLDKRDLRVLEVLRLGEDLSSDLGAVRCDGRKAYISVRNGKMIVMDLETRSWRKVETGDSSSWDHAVVGNRLYVGTVGGELLAFDTDGMRPLGALALCKKNIYSVHYHEGILYTVSQDQTIRTVDAETFQPLCTAKGAVKGMTRILGVYGDWLVVADGSVSLWDKQTLQLRGRIAMPTGHFNKGALLRGERLFGSDYHSLYALSALPRGD